MGVIRALIILVLAGLILGGSAYVSYELFWKPKVLDEQDRITKESRLVAEAPPDLSLPVFEKAMALLKAGKSSEAQLAFQDFLRVFPKSTKTAEVRRELGTLNLATVFTPGGSADTVSYTVKSGDSLVRVASKFKTHADLIYRASGLDSINLQIGQKLTVPKLEPGIEIDRTAGTVTLLNQGAFFKDYAVLSTKVPTGVRSTKVVDKVALKDSKRVAFGSRDYAESERWLMLGGGVMIRGYVAKAGETPPTGILLSPSDMDELFVLVSRGVPVTIK